jgi:hypothetical protein
MAFSVAWVEIGTDPTLSHLCLNQQKPVLQLGINIVKPTWSSNPKANPSKRIQNRSDVAE